MLLHARGSFEPKGTPQKPDSPAAEAANLQRLSLDKQYHGELEGVGKGEMIAAQTEVKGSAGYVAMERVTGTLNGRRGSFILQHSGTMSAGTSSLSITVVPDSGTDELQGISGTMSIIIGPDGRHSYDFEYALK
jgi:hypothetical protein